MYFYSCSLTSYQLADGKDYGQCQTEGKQFLEHKTMKPNRSFNVPNHHNFSGNFYTCPERFS